MGLVNTIANGATKALGYGKRIAKVTPEFLLGDSSEIIGKAMKAQSGSIWQKGKAGFRALENYNNAQAGNFFSRAWSNLKGLPKSISSGYKTAATAAKAAGKSGVWAGVKGAGKAIAKKMPLIGAALTVAIEAPNIYRAFKEGGFCAGMKEVGGAAVELGGMAAGAAIGSCFGPAGTVVGGLLGGIVGMFARGKTYTQKKEEEAQKPEPVVYNEAQKQALLNVGLTEEDIKGFQENGLPFEGVEKAVIEEIKAQGIDPAEVYISPKDLEKMAAQEQQLQQQYDPANAYNYENITYSPSTGLNNPYAIYPNSDITQSLAQNRYANDIYYQAIFGPNNTLNPYATPVNSNPFANPYDLTQNQYYV